MMQVTTQTTTVSGASGTVCKRTGPYKSNRNASITMVVQAGDLFPPDTDGQSTNWSQTVEKQTVTYTMELE